MNIVSVSYPKSPFANPQEANTYLPLCATCPTPYPGYFHMEYQHTVPLVGVFAHVNCKEEHAICLNFLLWMNLALTLKPADWCCFTTKICNNFKSLQKGLHLFIP